MRSKFGVSGWTLEWEEPMHLLSLLASLVIPGSGELDEPSVIPASCVASWRVHGRRQ